MGIGLTWPRVTSKVHLSGLIKQKPMSLRYNTPSIIRHLWWLGGIRTLGVLYSGCGRTLGVLCGGGGVGRRITLGCADSVIGPSSLDLVTTDDVRRPLDAV